MEERENILGTEKVGKLMRKFAIPTIISMLVNSLYNIVDQIFIGWGVGYLGNGATNIVFPMTVVAMAFALMIGDGTSAYLSLKLGEKKKEEAARGVASGVISVAAVALILAITFCLFLTPILNLFGCTDSLREYALPYGRIIVCGFPFMMLGMALNGIIRADGSPKYSMISMVTGAILNIVLDPITIFVLGLGVQGAAIATVISQFVVFLMNIIYVKKFKSISLNKETFKFDFGTALKVWTLGISSFITQMSIVLVIGVENNLLVKYGNESEFGADIVITVLGIVMKINQILNSVVIGVAVGSQPIIGYNYGARKFDRVKKTLFLMLGIDFAISLVAFVLFQTIPDKLISIFGSGDELYIKFACITFRVYLMLVMMAGIQIPSGIFFQAIGKSSKSAVLSLSRQVLILIPAMIILSSMFGLMGILYAGPVADGLACLISISLLIIEVKSLGKKVVKSESLVDDTSTDNILNNQVVITISREYGSGGRYIGRLVADKLGIKFYDKDLVEKIVEKTGLDEKYIESHEQKLDTLGLLNNGYYSGLNNADELFIAESEIIQDIADKESCVIIGRCSDYILKDRKNVLKVFISSSTENKIKRAVEFYGLDAKKAEKEIERKDKLRANHYKHYTGRHWNDASNYDICLNSDLYGVEKAAEMICDMAKKM